MNKLVLIVWSAFMILTTSQQAKACSCEVLNAFGKSVRQQVDESRSAAKAVFVGEVVKIDEPPNALSKTVTLRVQSIWKGIESNTATIVTGRGGGDCGYPFELGISYLVYTYQVRDASLATGICQRTADFHRSLVDLEFLGEPLDYKNVIRQNKIVRYPDRPATDDHFSDTSRIKLVGTTSDIEIGEKPNSSHTFIDIGLNLSLLNVGTGALLLLKQTPDCLAADVAKTVADLESRNGTFSSQSFATSSYFVDDKQWSLYKKDLDKKSPPANRISTLLLANKIDYPDGVRLWLPKKQYKQNGLSERYTLEDLQELSPFFIQLRRCSFDNYGIMEVKRERFGFAKKLQKRWSKFGYLLLNDFESEPIEVDLMMGTVHGEP